MKYLIFYIASLAFGGAGAWLISRWGTTMGLLDRANDRSSHKGVVPKGGGIGILAAFLLASWVLGLPVLFWMCAGLVSLRKRMIRMDGWKGAWERMIRMNLGRMGRLTRPHRRHLYQLLANEMEVDHWKVAVGYGVLQLVVGMSVLLLRDFGSILVLAVLAGYFGAFVGVSFRIRRRLGD